MNGFIVDVRQRAVQRIARGDTALHHRNTLLRQLSRADQLLPQPLGDNSVNVAVALDVLYWRGAPSAVYQFTTRGG